MARQRYTDFMDMIDGGGRGRRGDKFQGGGLLSMIGNAIGATPYGSQDEDRRKQMQQLRGIMDAIGIAPPAPPRGTARVAPQVAAANNPDPQLMPPLRANAGTRPEGYIPTLGGGDPAMRMTPSRGVPDQVRYPPVSSSVGLSGDGDDPSMIPPLGPAMAKAMQDPNFADFLKTARSMERYNSITDEYLAQNYLDHIGSR
jgi:hypothetical protein